jgi:hypothetical protein
MLASELVSDFQRYCRSEDEACEHMSPAAMGRRLKQRGFEGKRTALGKRYGLRSHATGSNVADVVNLVGDWHSISQQVADAFNEE